MEYFYIVSMRITFYSMSKVVCKDISISLIYNNMTNVTAKIQSRPTNLRSGREVKTGDEAR